MLIASHEGVANDKKGTTRWVRRKVSLPEKKKGPRGKKKKEKKLVHSEWPRGSLWSKGGRGKGCMKGGRAVFLGGSNQQKRIGSIMLDGEIKKNEVFSQGFFRGGVYHKIRGNTREKVSNRGLFPLSIRGASLAKSREKKNV